MNIQEAKEEIKKTVKAYTARTETGTFCIPVKRQRPVLLIGPPGIGKTAIVEQIARECSLGLVSYTMTHHTRQSAIGLPVLRQREFQGKEYTVTAYTMSEIIASVYAQIEQSGCHEGILFLDEINCVSETLMPAMLQFLQYKTFGSHRLPEGWVIVAAGNPPSYNRSVREFDTVTLDRVKRMEVEPDLEVWKRYALVRGLHPAVLSFLDLRLECFYVMEAGRKGFVTGRGWEDLSEMLFTLEGLGLSVEEVLFGQYLQEEETARTFAFYYRLYEKWNRRIHPERILMGEYLEEAEHSGELPGLPFDERLCIVWLLLQKMHHMAEDFREQERLTKSLQYFTDGLKQKGKLEGTGLEQACIEGLERRKKGVLVRKEYGLLEPEEEGREKRLAQAIQSCMERARNTKGLRAFRDRIDMERKREEEQQKELTSALKNGIDFVCKVFGKGQELVILLTGILEHPDTGQAMREELPGEYQRAAVFLNGGLKEEVLRERILEENAGK